MKLNCVPKEIIAKENKRRALEDQRIRKAKRVSFRAGLKRLLK
jgi:hypothetical protein